MSTLRIAAHSALRPAIFIRHRNVLRRLVVPLVILGVWELVCELGLVRPLILPPPHAVWDAFTGMKGQLPGAILTTLSITLTGFLIGTAIGLAMGLVMAYSVIARDFFGTIFDFLRPVPIFALIPLFLLWFGIGKPPEVALVSMGCAVILGVSTSEAIRNIPSIYIRAGLTLGARRSGIYRTVIIPYIFPHLVGAIRLAAASAWGLDVAAEFMGSQQGLGYLIIEQQIYLRTAGIFVLVFVYCILAIVFDVLIARIERHVTRWTERRSAKGIVASIVGSQ
jgi:ABC-type nitrate/sulfonate/bicarbonate transport system permease component